jgi:hypothetical protein
MHFNWFSRTVHAGVLDQKLTFFTDETWFQLSRFVGLKLIGLGTGTLLIRDRLLRCPFTIRKLVCGVPFLLHE